jgi:hypothetical protein
VARLMVVAALFLVVCAAFGTLRYRIAPDALEILMLNLVVRRIRLGDIEEVHRRGALLHESWSTLKFWNSVTIRRRTGLLRNLVVSPDDPEAFTERLRAAVREARGGAPASGQ